MSNAARFRSARLTKASVTPYIQSVIGTAYPLRPAKNLRLLSASIRWCSGKSSRVSSWFLDEDAMKNAMVVGRGEAKLGMHK